MDVVVGCVQGEGVCVMHVHVCVRVCVFVLSPKRSTLVSSLLLLLMYSWRVPVSNTSPSTMLQRYSLMLLYCRRMTPLEEGTLSCGHHLQNRQDTYLVNQKHHRKNHMHGEGKHREHRGQECRHEVTVVFTIPPDGW